MIWQVEAWLAGSCALGFFAALLALVLNAEGDNDARVCAILFFTCWAWPMYLVLLILYLIVALVGIAFGAEEHPFIMAWDWVDGMRAGK